MTGTLFSITLRISTLFYLSMLALAAKGQTCPNVPLLGVPNGGPSTNWHLPPGQQVNVSYGNIPTQMGWDFKADPQSTVAVNTAQVENTMNDALDAWTSINSGPGNTNISFDESVILAPALSSQSTGFLVSSLPIRMIQQVAGLPAQKA